MIMSAKSQTILQGDQLAGGFYTVREAARLLRLDSSRKVSRWVTGANAIVERQYEKLGVHNEIGFFDLIEIRFVDHFRKERFSLQSLRIAAVNARKELNVSHPFAMSSVQFKSDRKTIFLDAARQSGDRICLNLMTNQIEFYDIIEDFLAQDLTFDPISGLATEWHPFRKDCPDVIISPYHAFGQPVVSDKHVATSAILSSFKADGSNYKTTADWFHISEQDVRQAVEFELKLAT
jgi:uncharacterized protein (DUF433 family)